MRNSIVSLRGPLSPVDTALILAAVQLNALLTILMQSGAALYPVLAVFFGPTVN
jgi:hypothetical protein